MKTPLFASVLLSGTILYSSPLYAVCTLAPDCADLGYTMSAADCEGQVAVKCPTDMSKVFCPKKSSENSLPILYGDGTVSKNVISGKTPIGIVFDETNKLAVSLTDVKKDGTAGSETMYWSNNSYDMPNLTNCQYNDNPASVDSCSVDGRSNTDKILACGSSCGGTPAATAANSYQPAGCTQDFCKKTKWFLPSIKEFSQMYSVGKLLDTTIAMLKDYGTVPFEAKWYWSSCEYDKETAWEFDKSDNTKNTNYKNSDDYVRPVVYYGEPKESGDVCTNEKWYLYLNFVGQKNGDVCSVKQADSSIVVESSTGKRGTVTEVALSGNVNANAWSNWAEIILDPGAERIGYIGDGAYISSFSKTCSNLPLGVEFLTEDSGEYLHEYAYNKGSVKIAWEYDNDETIATCSGDVTLIITENYTE